MFQNTTVDIGEVKIGEAVLIKFPFDPTNFHAFGEIKGSCDCTTFHADLSNNRLVVSYVPKPVPIHLAQTGKTSYEVTRMITVRYFTKPDTAGISVEHEQILVFNAINHE